MRRHLDFVASWTFHMQTDDDGFNTEVEAMVKEWQRPSYCDAAGVHPFPRLLRLTEAARLHHGDCGLVAMTNESLFGVEGDCIRTPEAASVADMFGAENVRRWVHGVQVNSRGRRLSYGLWARQSNGYVFDREVPARNFFHHGFYQRFHQIRGVSPMTAQIDGAKDVYQSRDYIGQKVKAASVVALAIYSQMADLGIDHEIIDTTEDEDGDGDTDDEVQTQRYEVDFSQGPIKLELEHGDKAEMVQDKSPSTETINFLNWCLMCCLKALDIPFNFWDEAHTNFFGSRAAWILYQVACDDKRLDVADLLRRITVWLFRNWIRNAVTGTGHFKLDLPRRWTMEDVKFRWVPRGIPWWKPSEELDTELKAIEAGIMNPYEVCHQHGFGDFEVNWAATCRAVRRATEIAKKEGVPELKPIFTANVSPIQVVTSAD